MNSFANGLFSTMFGWIRGIFQGVWSAASKGEISRFLTWLGDHWLVTLALLCLACTVLDYLVWLIRWRPYLVWRTWMRSFLRRIRGERVNDRQFSQGYQEAVSLDIPAYEAPLPQEWAQEEAYSQEGAYPQESAYSAKWAQEAQPDPAEQVLAQEFQRKPLPLEGGVPRRRRSEKHERRWDAWRQRLIKPDEDGEDMLDGLPPAVDRESAFREPVYPQRAPQEADAWQRPVNYTNGK